jgi:tetratricopeptide (TPR) repeat protein
MSVIRSAALAAALALLALAVFAGSLGHQFTNWDDQEYVTGNALIRKLDPGAVREMFRTSSVHVGNWAPVTILSYSLDYAVWRDRPLGYHLTNVLLHALTTVLLYLLLCRLLARGAPRASKAPAAVAAALFAVHPVQVESVAWIAERKNMLGMVFLLAAFLSWARATRGGLRIGAYAAFLAFLTLSLLSKAHAVILPPLLVLYEWIERPARDRSGLPGTLRPALLIPAFVLAVWVTGVTLGAQSVTERARLTGDLLGAIATAPLLVFGYVEDLLFPMNRAAILLRNVYEIPWAPVSLTAWIFLGAWVLFAIGVRKRFPHACFFSLWFLGALAPVLNLVPLPVLAADRYQYWAAPALFSLTGLAAHRGWVAFTPARRAALAILGGTALALLILLTLARVPVWENAITLWTQALRQAPDNHVVRTNLAAGLLAGGRPSESLEHLHYLLRITPRNPRIRVNLAVAYYKLGRLDEAIREARAATALNRRSLEAWLLLGTALEAKGKKTEAIDAFRRALVLSPGHPAALAHLRALGKAPEARSPLP